MRLRRWLIAVGLLFLLGWAGVASAHTIEQGDQCSVDADETIEGNLFILCRTLTLDGHITGNVIGAATSAVINGTVGGDIYLLAGQLDLHGTVGEDVHFAGLALTMHDDLTLASPRADLLTASLSTTLAEGATVPGSVVSVGYQLVTGGAVGGEMSFWGSSLTINGTVGGDVYAEVGDAQADVSQLQALLIPFPLDLTLNRPGLRVNQGAHVGGQLRYAGPTEGEIAPDTLVNPAIYTPVLVQPDLTQIALGEEDQSRGLSIYIAQVAREFFTLGLIGVIGLALAPRAMQSPLRSLQARPLPCLGVGLLAFIISFVAVPFVILLSILLVVAVSLLQVNELTLAVATILGVLDVGGASFLFFVVIFVSRVIMCLALGRMIARMLWGDDGSVRTLFVSLLIGVVLLAIVASLPFVGWIINAAAAFLGLGAILTLIQSRVETSRESANAPRYVAVTPPTLPRRAEEPRLVPPPPPILEDNPRPLGMENLPEGFKWWDDEER